MKKATHTNRSESLSSIVRRLPGNPGVYLMKNQEGEILYVGKAGNLKKRLSTYFTTGAVHSIKTRILVKQVHRFDTIITTTESEALILEATLIKKHLPRYNVILKDDKRYPSLRLDLSHPFPRLFIVRKIKKDESRYFGPFSSAAAVRQTLKFVNRTFALRKCKDREFAQRSRPCLHHQMGSCLAPCCYPVDKSDYDKIVKEVVLFLNGRTPELVRSFQRKMKKAAAAQDFEKAAAFRDRMFALQRTLEKQVAVATDLKDRDVIAVAKKDDFPHAVAVLLTVRQGLLQGSRAYPITGQLVDDGEIISGFLRQYYTGAYRIPPEILVMVMPEDGSLLEKNLTEIRSKKVRLVCPMRGEKRRLMEMACANARKELREAAEALAGRKELLRRLQRRLHLNQPIRRIECFDISNLAGTNPVAGMITFQDGRPERKSYRKFAIRSVTKPDDYAAMEEALTRRFGGSDRKPDGYPDLLMIDGGKGQLNIAVSVLQRLPHTRPPVIAIAKKDVDRGIGEDRIFLPGRSNPVNFGKESDLLMFLQRIRDEAHRFAISYQRRKRGKTYKNSILDTVDGIGPQRRRMLLTTFGSVEKIAAAPISALTGIPGITESMAVGVQKAIAGRKP